MTNLHRVNIFSSTVSISFVHGTDSFTVDNPSHMIWVPFDAVNMEIGGCIESEIRVILVVLVVGSIHSSLGEIVAFKVGRRITLEEIWRALGVSYRLLTWT
jgi:hypothetical protein